MHDLVTEYSGELGFGVHFRQEATIDRDLAAGKRPGVGHRAVQDDEFIGQLTITDGGQFSAHHLDVGCQFRVNVILASPGLLHVGVILGAELNFLRFADQRELSFSSNGIDGTAGQAEQQEQQIYGIFGHSSVSPNRIYRTDR